MELPEDEATESCMVDDGESGLSSSSQSSFSFDSLLERDKESLRETMLNSRGAGHSQTEADDN